MEGEAARGYYGWETKRKFSGKETGNGWERKYKNGEMTKGKEKGKTSGKRERQVSRKAKGNKQERI